MSLKIGIVGLPNVGKSTLFNTLTKKQVPAENYPFCTIDPNVGVVAVKDSRIDNLAQLSSSKKKVYATVDFVDIAGIVKGASEGAGLGNKFLSEILEVDAIAQVVRIFENKDIIHVENKIDPKSDIEVINTELILKDLEIITKIIDRVQKEARVNPKYSRYLEFLQNIKTDMDRGILARDSVIKHKTESLIEDEIFQVEYKQLQLLTNKPFLYIANLSDNKEDIRLSQDQNELKKLLGLNDSDTVLGLSVKLESELAQLTEEEAIEFMKEYGLTESGLDRLIRKSYEMLGLISFLTTGEDESRAWTIHRGTNARQAAGTIHTDFYDKFIVAETVDYETFVKLGGYKGSRNAGKIRQESRDYVMEEGDIVEFKIGK